MSSSTSESFLAAIACQVTLGAAGGHSLQQLPYLGKGQSGMASGGDHHQVI